MAPGKATVTTWISLILRWIMEAGIVLGLIYWGVFTGDSTEMKVILAVLAPVVVFGFWGFVDFRWIGRSKEAVRLIQELAITGLVAVALVTAGKPFPAWLLIAVSIGHHVLLYLTGGRLLKETQ